MPKNAHISYDSAINVYEAYPAEYKRYSKHTTSDDKTVYPCWRGAVDDVDLRQGCNRNDWLGRISDARSTRLSRNSDMHFFLDHNFFLR